MAARPHLDLDTLEGVFPARQARSRAVQEALLRAGDAVFARVGYYDAHLTEIAGAAGCTVGAFYSRFRDKEALFQALLAQFAQRGRGNIERFFAMPRWRDAAPATVIEGYIEGTARVLKRNAGFFHALYQRNLAGEDADNWTELRAGTRLAGEHLAAWLRVRLPDADRPNLVDDCVFCVRTAEGTLIHRLLAGRSPDEFDHAFTVRSLSAMIVAYLRV